MRAVLILSILLVMQSCSETHSSSNETYAVTWSNEPLTAAEARLMPAAYMKWIEAKQHGLRVEKRIGDFTYTAQYKPLEYVALLELRKDSITGTALKNKMEEFNGLQYFTFQISADAQQELLKINLKEPAGYYERIQYFSFDMQHDLKLIDGKDTLNCELFHFERVFGLAPYARFTLGFPATKNDREKTLVYEDVVFGSGKIYLGIRAMNKNQLPAVITL